MVCADDDEWNIGQPEMPVFEPAHTSRLAFTSVQQAFNCAANGMDRNAATESCPMSNGYYQYDYNYENVGKEMYKKCYKDGYGPPKRYEQEESIWDIEEGYVRTIRAGQTDCSIPDEGFEARASDWVRNKKITDADKLETSMKKYHAYPDTGNNDYHYNNLEEETTTVDLVLGRQYTDRRVWYPYNTENARDQAIRYARELSSLHNQDASGRTEMCRLWNIVTNRGLEFHDVPEYDKHQELNLKNMLHQAIVKYDIQILTYDNETLTDTWVTLTNDNFDETVKNLAMNITNDPSGLDNEPKFSLRLTCEDYGYEKITTDELNDPDFIHRIEMNPTIMSDGSDINREPSNVDVYMWSGYASQVRTRININDNHPTILSTPEDAVLPTKHDRYKHWENAEKLEEQDRVNENEAREIWEICEKKVFEEKEIECESSQEGLFSDIFSAFSGPCTRYAVPDIAECMQDVMDEAKRFNSDFDTFMTRVKVLNGADAQYYVQPGSCIFNNDPAFAYKYCYNEYDSSKVKALPNSKLFCKINYKHQPVQTDHLGGANYKYVMERTLDAHYAVMSWAHVNCLPDPGRCYTPGYGYGHESEEECIRQGWEWVPPEEWSCLLGSNDINVATFAATLPVPFGFQIGFTRKTLAKSGFMFIVYDDYSFCLVNEEEAIVSGPRLAWQPGKTKDAYDKLVKEQGSKAVTGKVFAKAAGENMKKSILSPSKYIYNKDSKNIGGVSKFLIGNIGREITNAQAKSFSKSTGFPTKFETEYWVEEGSCNHLEDDCKLKTKKFTWQMVAGSVSFIGSSARVSYYRVYESPLSDGGLSSWFMGAANIIPGAAWIEKASASGWDRYLRHTKAILRLVPNMGQIINMNMGRPGAVGGKPKKMGLRNILNEIQVSVEWAYGRGDFYLVHPSGRHKMNVWKDYHEPREKHWSIELYKELSHTQPKMPLVDCFSPFEKDEDAIVNRFPVNSCPNNDKHSDYTPVAAPYREAQMRIPVTHFRFEAPGAHHQLRRKSCPEYCHNPPDIAVNTVSSINQPLRLNLSPNKIILNANMSLSHLPSLDESFIYGRGANFDYDHVTYNPFAITRTNETSGKVTVKKQYIELQHDTCETMGLTPIFMLDHEYNKHLAELFYGKYHNIQASTWKEEIREDDFFEITIDEAGTVSRKDIDEDPDEGQQGIHSKMNRPYGLLVSTPDETTNEQWMRQTERIVYGQKSTIPGTIAKHTDCSYDYRCICLPETEYAYVRYSHANKSASLFMHPIHTYQECKIAHQHLSDFTDESIFKPLEYYMNRQYTKSGVTVIHKDNKKFGCIYENGVVFNDHPDATLDVGSTSVIKLHFYDTIQEVESYPRYVHVKPTKFNGSNMHESTRQKLDSLVTQSIQPKGDHRVKQVQQVFQNNILGYFPRELDYEALKDMDAVHVVSTRDSIDRLTSWKFVDKYYNKNVDKLEEYSSEYDQELMINIKYISEIDTYDRWNTSQLPEGNADYSFVQNLGLLSNSTDDITVPDVDFIYKGQVSFHGKNIPMKKIFGTNLGNIEPIYRCVGKDTVTQNVCENFGGTWNGKCTFDKNKEDCAKIKFKFDIVKSGGSCTVDITTSESFCPVATSWETTYKKDSTEYSTLSGILDNAKSCHDSLMLPNRCPEGYGMDGDLIDICSNNSFTTESTCAGYTWGKKPKDDYGIPFMYGEQRQCALCPVVATCHAQCGCDNGECSRRFSSLCLDCLSPEGRYRCQRDITRCDTPGFIKVQTRRGGAGARLSTHCVKTDVDPKEETDWHSTTLQKEYWDRGEPFFPKMWKEGNTQYVRNEESYTKYLTCESGYVPVMEDTKRCSDTSFDTQIDCEEESKYTWDYGTTCSGYVCKRCPPTFYEKDQICVKCGEREVAGHSLGSFYDANTCYKVDVPIGHFFDSQNQVGVTISQGCSIVGKSKDDCNSSSVNTWTLCSDGSDAEEPDCLSQKGTWDGICSIPLIMNEQDCTSTPVNTWGTCDNTRFDNKEDCLIEKGQWTEPKYYPFVSHCDKWLVHPAGSMGAYQDEVNQLSCKTTNTSHTNFGEYATFYPTGATKTEHVPGVRVNQARTKAVPCKDEEICNGEEIVGCAPGWIWYQQTEDRDDDECLKCNQNPDTFDMHNEKDNYEFCDGSHRFKCAAASYTDIKPGDFKNNYVGVRSTWNVSNLVVPSFNWATFQNWEFTPADSDAYWGDSSNSRIESYTIGTINRVTDNIHFNKGAQCYPVPDGSYALPNQWQNISCGNLVPLCEHRTFHEVFTEIPKCTDAPKYPFSNAIKGQCYDDIERYDSTICTDGTLPNGCNKEYCTREGQSNCWCGEESEEFCTMGCVEGLCQEICGDKVCEPYEVCYGEFNAIQSFAQCVIACQGPKSNYCLYKDLNVTANPDGKLVYCRHYNENWDVAPLNLIDNGGPCFDEMPNIPETQCLLPDSTECFCGRVFIQDDVACYFGNFPEVKPKCDQRQDDGTCTFSESSDGTCMCGHELIDKSGICYDNGNDCSDVTTQKSCKDTLDGDESVNMKGCQPEGSEVNAAKCSQGHTIEKKYGEITVSAEMKCLGRDVSNIKGCFDPAADNHNEFATIPTQCIYA